MLVLYAALWFVSRPACRAIQVAWCRLVLALAGLRVTVTGERHRGGPTLFAANHVSYLDIPVLSSAIEATFVAKSEVADWPLFGAIAQVTRTVFVSRSGPKARAQRDEIRRRLGRGENLLLFPEGTSTDGRSVVAFKSSLFGLVDAGPEAVGGGGAPADVVVQPVSVAYVRYADGRPLADGLTDLYCWYGEATLVPHLWRVLGLRGATVELRFHPPIAADDADRKALARASHAAVAAGVAEAHATAAAAASGAPSAGTGA